MKDVVDLKRRRLNERASLSEAQRRALVWGEAAGRPWSMTALIVAAFVVGAAIGWIAITLFD